MRGYSGGVGEVTGDDVLFGGVAMDAFGDDPVGDVFEVIAEGGAEVEVLRPEGFVNEGAGDADHDGGAALAGVTVGFEAITTEQGYEEFL